MSAPPPSPGPNPTPFVPAPSDSSPPFPGPCSVPDDPSLTRAVVDVLGDLEASERNSLIRMVRSNLPVLSRCSPHLLGVLRSLDDERIARSRSLRDLLSRLQIPVRPEQHRTGEPDLHAASVDGKSQQGTGPATDPFLSLLSLRFLLLKLAEAQAQLRTRYLNCQPTISAHRPSAELVAAHVANVTAGFHRLEHELRAMGLDPSPEG